MSDYLWDKTGEADPEVEQLENLLGAFGHRPRPLELPPAAASRPRRFDAARLAAAAALLLAVLAGALVTLRHARTGEAPVVDNGAPRETTPTRVVAPPEESLTTPPPGPDERFAGGDAPVRHERRATEAAAGFKRRRGLVSTAKAGAESRVEVGGGAERVQAKEQLVYALRLTSARLEEVRRKVQGDAESRTPPPGRGRTR